MSQPFRVIWGYRLWLIAFALVAFAVVYYLSDRQDPSYESKALAQIVSGQQASGELLSQEELLNLTNIYAEVAQTTAVTERARKNAGFQGSREDFETHLGVQPEQDLGVLELIGSDTAPALAAKYANAYADAIQAEVQRQQTTGRADALDRVRDRVAEINTELEGNIDPARELTLRAELQTLQSRIADELLRPGDSIRVIQQGTPTSSPVSPKPWRDAIAAGIAALLLGMAAVYLRSRLTDRYTSSDDASVDLKLPILAQVPRGNTEDYASIEALRSLRTRVEFALRDRKGATAPGGGQGRLLLVTSAEPGAGKTFISSNLARMLAAAGRRVTAVDGDLRRPTLHTAYDAAMSPGLRDALVGGAAIPLERLTQVINPGGDVPGSAATGELKLLPAGTSIDDSSEAISSPRMIRIFDQLRESSDYIVTDSPPILAVTDAAILNLYVDGVLLVLDASRTRRRDARRTVQTLRALDAHVLGIVFNRSEDAEVYPYFYGRSAPLVGSASSS